MGTVGVAGVAGTVGTLGAVDGETFATPVIVVVAPNEVDTADGVAFGPVIPVIIAADAAVPSTSPPLLAEVAVVYVSTGDVAVDRRVS